MSEPRMETPGVTRFGGKSWTEYVKSTLVALLLGCIGMFFLDTEFWQVSVALAGLAIVYLLHKILLLRSYRFFMDDVGIWEQHGYLPWAKFGSGVKWRDLDDAFYYPNFFSWLCRSYKVLIQHRYTKVSQLYLSGMHRGKFAVGEIRRVHQTKIRSRMLG